jgi:hypothetical protein
MKVIRKRTVNQSHSHRLEDMQATFLVELFAITRSLRPPLQLSKPFVDTYHCLAREHDADNTNALIATINSFDSLHETPCTLEAESTRRLLSACYILDTQHSTFFGREATENPDFEPSNLSLPQPLPLWDMPPAPQAAYYGETHCDHFVPQLLLPQATLAAQPSNDPPDIFTSMLLLAYTNSSSGSTNREPPSNPKHSTSTCRSPSPSPHIRLAHQTLALSALVSIRALLPVAGESWIQAAKLGSRAEYTKAQTDIRTWATSAAAKAALPVAVEIIRLHRLHPRTTFLFHEWSLHLAVLVVWAGFYVGREARRQQQRRLRVGGVGDLGAGVGVSGAELDGVVARLVNGGVIDPGAGLTWQDAKALLMWAKGRLEKGGIARFCGVLNGALYVLTALVERGDEDGWF